MNSDILRSKIHDLSTKIENDSISPVYLGTLLDEMVDASVASQEELDSINAAIGALDDAISDINETKADKSEVSQKLSRDDIEVISDITYDFREANGQLDNTKIYMVYEFESAPIGGGTPRPL